MRIVKPIERWFDVPDDPDKARLKIKHLTPGETTDIFEEVFTHNVSYTKNADGTYEPAFSQITDKKKDRNLTLSAAVVDWEKFFDSDGKPMQCTPDNVIRASREIDGFIELVTKFREVLSKDIAEERRAQEKNLPSSARKS